jgi:hypothetical protein
MTPRQTTFSQNIYFSIGLFILAKDFLGNKNKISLLSSKKPICSLLLKKKIVLRF